MSIKCQATALSQEELDYGLIEAAADGDEVRVTTLLDAGACIDAMVDNCISAVMLAAQFHNHRVVRLLLARGARVAQLHPANNALHAQDQAFMHSLFGQATV